MLVRSYEAAAFCEQTRRHILQVLLLLCLGGFSAWLVEGDCRMKSGAAHSHCGLPYELSNFQGQQRVFVTTM
jgi:hypothetical protein